MTRQPLQPAVFLDRDGTINEEVEYLSDPDRLRLLPGAADGVRLLNRAGIPVFIVTNQAGVGRGYFTVDDVEAVNQRLQVELRQQGAHVAGIDSCPHHPSDRCACRKPEPGMLLRAGSEHGLDMPRSFMVGDKQSDIAAGRNAGCRTVLVLTGYGVEQSQRCESSGAHPDHIASDLHEAARWIVETLASESSAGSSPTPPA